MSLRTLTIGLIGVAFIGVWACGTRTVIEDRFQQSISSAPLDLTVSLPDPNKFSFALVGDTHVGNKNVDRLKSILDAADAEGDAFIVLAGDLVNDGKLEDYQAIKTLIEDEGWNGRVLAVSGNHDVFEEGWTHYQATFGSSTFVATVGNSRFIAIDTSDGVVGESQADWLLARLNEPGPTHTFVVSHYMPIIPGIRTYLKLSDREEAHRMMALVSQFDVSGWLGGHYHSFVQKNISGVEYVVAGGGGGRRMDPVRDFFFVQVSVDGEGLSYAVRTVP